MSKSKSEWFTSGLQKKFIAVVLGVGIILVGMTAYDRSINQRVQDVVGRCTTHHANYEVISYMQKTKNYNLLVADTPEKQEYGLMNITSKDDICGYDGMIFRYRTPQIYTFWNKNTLVDLELTWRNETTKYESTITLPNITDHGMSTVSPQAPVDTVIEIIKFTDNDNKLKGNAKKTCVVGGCSGQLCTEASIGGKGVMSTCEWREIYACYRDAQCAYDERTRSCQWVLNDKLKKCLSAQETAPL